MFSQSRRLARALAVGVALTAAVAAADEVVPPEVLTRVDAVPPVDATPPAQDHVLLEFTIEEDGTVHDVVVLESAGPQWDEAAKTALRQWTFKPALHRGKTVASRTRLPFNVALPEPEPVDAGVAIETNDAGVELATETDADAGVEVVQREYSTKVTGRTIPKSRGASDFHIEVGSLRLVPRKSASEMLKLAPGILLTNEGGEGHPDQIFLRGFDAREGQDIELSTDGVPVNESGNLHGNGYADLHFIIPELVESLRVIEGPFDPRQGNYAVAGSADYELGLADRGVTAKGTVGLYDTQRLVFLWGPPGESSRSFAGVQLYRTGGWGMNRDAQNASAMAQYELSLSESTTLRVAANGYATRFHSAGLVRADDVAAGRIGFYDTYDSRQGGDTARGSAYLDLAYHAGDFSQRHTLYAIVRNARLSDNYTGFLNDPQQPRQQPHGQRGDLLDRNTTATTIGLKGFGKYRGRVLERAQELEVGYFARVDITSGLQQAIEANSNTPYRRDLDLNSTLSDIGLYADANLQLLSWLVLRGGVRGDLFTYNIHNNCAVTDVRRPSTTNPPGDASCLAEKDFGVYREPDERSTAVGSVLMPRGTLLVGPFKGVTFSGSAGTGVRSIDPQYVSQNVDTPFARIFAWEGGVSTAHKPTETFDLSGRAVFFGTRVDKDLIFNEQAGRNIVGGATSRLGGLVAGRGRGSFFDLSVNATYVQSKFDDTGLLVPYVPDVVVRGDGSLFHALPWEVAGAPLKLSLGVGYTFVGRRALPYGQRSDVISIFDANIEAQWRWLTLGVASTNLLGTQYRLGEYNFPSDWKLNGVTPSLVPGRQFTAGAPRQILVSLAINLGGDR